MIKVSKFQSQIFFFSSEPKNKLNYFLNSALMIQNKPNKKEHIPLNTLQGGIQQLRGQEGGEGGSAKSPCLGGSLDVHLDKNLKEKYRAIMANYYEKSYFFTFCSALTKKCST